MKEWSLVECMLIGKGGRRNKYKKVLSEMNKPYDDSNWREEYKGYTSSRYELDLLENGPKSLAQSWMMGALHNKWKKMKGYKDPEPPDCSSSLKEWEESVKKYAD